MTAPNPFPEPGLVDLRALVGHRSCVAGEETLEEVQKIFEKIPYEFMAVSEGESVLGICSKQEVAVRLGTRYGFAIYARKPISQFLREECRVTTSDSLASVLEKVFSRNGSTFYDDVLLVDRSGGLIGLIFVRELVRLQTCILSENLLRVEAQKREIERRREELEQDLRMAREIQSAFLPAHYPAFVSPHAPAAAEPALRFYHYYRPAATIGGDFFSVRKITDSQVGIVFGDVMGHGIRSALITAILRALVEELVDGGAAPGEVLSRINEDLRAILRNAGSPLFVSALAAQIDLESGTIRYANGGHPAPLLLNRKKRHVFPLEPASGRHGTVLGLIDQARYETFEAAFPCGDALLFFTDGVFEIERNDVEFGMERLRHELRQNIHADPCGLITTLVGHLQSFAGEAEFPDDLCLLAVERQV